MIDLGIVRPGTTLYIPFATYDSNDPSASVTLTGLATTDIEVYKNGSTTQRASDAGYALLDTDGIDFDGVTGINGFSIDLADNTTAGFWEAGAQYWVVVSSITVDAGTVNFIAATFRIGYPGSILDTSIASLSSQTSFTLTAGPAEDDALNGMWAVIHDVASAVQFAKVLILDYTGSTKTVTLAAGATFTAAATDNISIIDLAPLQPTTTGRTLDVSTGGEAGVDWANVGSPTTSLALTGTTIATTQKVDIETIKTQAVTCAAGVTVSPYVGSTGAAINGTNANTLSSHDPGATLGTSTLTQTQVTGGAYALNSASFAFNAAVPLTTQQKADVTAAVPTAAGIADAVWDENASGHQTQRSFGQVLGDSVADTSSIHAYASANYVHLDTTVVPTVQAILTDTAEIGAAGAGLTALATQASVNTIDDFLDTEIAAILADTNELQTDWADGGRLDLILDARASQASVDTIDGNVDSILATVAKLDDTLEDDAGTYRFTTNALEQAPSGGGGGDATAANQTTIISHLTDIKGATFDGSTDSIEAIRNRGDAAWVTATGFSTLDAAGVRAAVGLASANLDTQLDALPTAAEITTAVWAKAMTELASVPGVTGSVLEALQWCFLLARNKVTQTSTAQTLRNDADSGSIGTATVSDDGTTATRGEWA